MAADVMTADFRIWRARLRLISGLTMLSFVICHLTAHCLLLVSFEDAEATRNVLMYPWRTFIGTAILTTAFLVHYNNALWSIYIRRSLRLSRWELTQLTLGLCIPFLLMFHVVGTRIAEITLDTTTYYNTVFIGQWLHRPWLGAVQMIAVVTVWVHASIGAHYWLRTKRWYPTWQPLFFGYSLLLPALALAGYVTGGNQVLREATADPDFVKSSLEDSNITPQLPYDVLFILNQFFHEMTQALAATNGHYSQFTGDGLMALYGLYAADPKTGPVDAVRGARQMLERLDQLNYRLRGDLREPLRIGIGIHYSEAIVGAMGPPRSQMITAIGDPVNTCARLESLTKEYCCAVIISRQAADAAGLNLAGHELHEAQVKGRREPVQFYALRTLADLEL